MGRDELKLRENWQTVSGRLALSMETDFATICQYLFEGTNYRVVNRPKDFAHIYESWPLSDIEISQLYTPNRPYRHGFIPDFSLVNLLTDKRIYVEVKRQDGWVEGLSRSAGRGNAQERLCKYFTPGLISILRSHSGVTDGLPFWIVFTGNITRDPCRVREISCWFDGYLNHIFFWRDNNPQSLYMHFIEKIAPLLD